MNKRRVAVTGMGAVTPIGNGIPAFTESLFAGKNGIGPITRFDTTDYKVRIAAEVKDFDPAQYSDRGEIRRIDLYSHYAIAAASEAFEDAGLNNFPYDPWRMGVYMGSGIGGITTLTREHDRLLSGGPSRVSPYLIPMMISNMATGLLAMKFKAKGQSLPVVTACGTGSHSVGEAFRAIKDGYADIMISGGAEAAITPLGLAGFISCMALSQNSDPETACRPFDKNRDGFVMGEGAGCLILEEYEHAKARGAKIYAEIAGYGSTNDAYHMTAPDPEGEGATHAMALAMQEAGLAPSDIGYVNAHGTSTPLNDKTETLAIKKAFGGAASRLAVSSTKSMTAHMLGAAGAIEAIATVLALQKGMLPPTIHYSEFDPECDLDVVPNAARKADITAAISNSLGFGGHNASILIKRV